MNSWISVVIGSYIFSCLLACPVLRDFEVYKQVESKRNLIFNVFFTVFWPLLLIKTFIKAIKDLYKLPW